ncbi:MAG: glycosyltransferase [Ruminococcus sp.]|nr:glycosyltransferase [Candidatus Copronaster equi]
MLISIVTAAYNSESTIKDTIESVLNQTHDEVEYIIIDGASKDKTAEIAESYREKFEAKGYKLIIVSEPDNGIYDAMNKGIELATGEIVGIINSDDWYSLHALKTVADTYEKEHFDMFYAQCANFNADGSFSHQKHCRDDVIVTSRHWNHPSTFITKKVYNELGAFQNKGGLYDDFDLYLRIRKAGKKRVISEEVLANFRLGGASDPHGIKYTWRLFKDKYRCYSDNGYSKLYVIECFLMEFVRYFYFMKTKDGSEK